MTFQQNRKRVAFNILALCSLILLIAICLPAWYALILNSILVSAIVASLFVLMEERSYMIENDTLLYTYKGRLVSIPLNEAVKIKKHTSFKMDLYTQYFAYFEGYEYELLKQYVNFQGRSIVEVLVNDYKLSVESVPWIRLVIKVKKEDNQ